MVSVNAIYRQAYISCKISHNFDTLKMVNERVFIMHHLTWTPKATNNISKCLICPWKFIVINFKLDFLIELETTLYMANPYFVIYYGKVQRTSFFFVYGEESAYFQHKVPFVRSLKLTRYRNRTIPPYTLH